MILLIISMIFAIIVALFAIQNAYTVSISFLWVEAEMPLVLVILGAAFAGAIIVFLIALWREFNLRRQSKAKYNEAVQAAQAQATQEAQKTIEGENTKNEMNDKAVERNSTQPG